MSEELCNRHVLLQSMYPLGGVTADWRLVSEAFRTLAETKAIRGISCSPTGLQELTGQRHIKFGDCVVLQSNDCFIASEMFEELVTPDCPSNRLGLDRIENTWNSSASHRELFGISRLPESLDR